MVKLVLITDGISSDQITHLSCTEGGDITFQSAGVSYVAKSRQALGSYILTDEDSLNEIVNIEAVALKNSELK